MLSGGEKSRVALAKTLISEANFLLLDEPTNHLDIQSVNILIQALQQYEGTSIIVSHNRHFISQVANKIWWIEDKKIKEYLGPYDEYVWWKNQNKASDKSNAPANNKKPKPKESKVKPKSSGEIKKLQNDMKDCEKEIEKFEIEKQKLEEELAKPEVFGNPDKLLEVNEKFKAVEERLEDLTEQWEKIGLQIEAQESV